MKSFLQITGRQKGFTLIELVITVAVLAVLGTLAVPQFSGYKEKRQLVSATEKLAAKLVFAKSESYKRSKDLYFKFSANGTTTWAYGISESSGCNPNSTNCTLTFRNANGTTSTVVQKVSSTDYPDVIMADPTFTADQFTFDNVRGTVGGGSILLSTSSYATRIIVSPYGRVRICSASGGTHLGRYPTC